MRDARMLDALHLTERHASEVSTEFLRGMASRMALSFEKYGAVKDAYPDKVDALASLETRLRKYRETGNTEYLMDVANFAMIEYMRPRHQQAHFKAEDSHASPGRTGTDGRSIGAAPNTDDHDAKATRQDFGRALDDQITHPAYRGRTGD